MNRIDRSKKRVSRSGSLFKPFRPSAEHEVPLAGENLKDETELLVFERGGQRRAVLTSQAIYHHLIQGKLEGEPYLVSY